jgi:hypothetical protein
MSAAAAQHIEGPPRRRGPRKQPHLLTGPEEMILRRMMRIDRGEGCHATVERIGLSVDDRHVSFSVSQTRRHLRRLREMGHIHFAGQTASGRNVYLFSEREYRPEQVPVCPSRPLDHLRTLPSAASWSTEKAVAILNLTDREGPAARVTLIDGFPVNKQLIKSYSETTIKRAVAALKKAYPDPAMMKNRTALLRYFITLEMQEEKKRRDRALAEQTKKVVQGAAAPAELGSQLLALMREGRHAEAKKLAESLEQAHAAGPAAAVNAERAPASTLGTAAPAPASAAGTATPAPASAAGTATLAPASAAGTATLAPASAAGTATPAPANISGAATTPTPRGSGTTSPPVPSNACMATLAPSLMSSTVGDAVARFVDRKHPGPGPAPASFYSKKAEQLQRLLGPIRLAELTPAELTLYQRKRRSERVQEGTVKAELKVLRQALGEAAATGLLELSVLENLLPTTSRAGPRKLGASGDPP